MQSDNNLAITTDLKLLHNFKERRDIFCISKIMTEQLCKKECSKIHPYSCAAVIHS